MAINGCFQSRAEISGAALISGVFTQGTGWPISQNVQRGVFNSLAIYLQVYY